MYQTSARQRAPSPQEFPPTSVYAVWGNSEMGRRYKGRRSGKSREFPAGVKVAVRWSSFGKRLNAMIAFHEQRGIHVALARQRHEGQDYVFWFFARREIAEDFATEFAGTLMDDSKRQARGR